MTRRERSNVGLYYYLLYRTVLVESWRSHVCVTVQKVRLCYVTEPVQTQSPMSLCPHTTREALQVPMAPLVLRKRDCLRVDRMGSRVTWLAKPQAAPVTDM